MPDIEFKTGAEWRKPREEGVPIRLPNGVWIKIRPISFDLFLKLARVPDHMTPIVERMLKDQGLDKGNDLTEVLKKTGAIELFRQDRKIKEEFARVAFVYPKVVDEPKNEDEISVDDLGFEELEFIMAFFGSPIIELETFSLRQRNTLESMDNKSSDLNQTKSIDEPVGVGEPETANAE